MKRIVLATTIALACMSARGQEQQDSLKSVSMMQKLQEVVVKGNLPNTRLKGNAMITRIQGTPLSDAGTLGEMLVKVPGMTGTDEAPEVLGKGSPLIYINGRLMRDNSELKRLRSEEIRDVEVISNPGAQYDATVRAVVRIRTVRQQGDGLSLDLTLSDEHDLRYDFDRPQAKIGANYRKNGIDVFGSVYYYHQDYRQYSTIEDITTTDKVFRQYGPYTMTWKHDNATELDCIVNQYTDQFCNPMVMWGRYRKSWLSTTLPISFQFHHVQMDGGHAARFLEELQKTINTI